MPTPLESARLLPVQLRDHPADGVLRRAGASPGYCLLCGRLTAFRIRHGNYRETCTCLHCRSFNRQRQLAYVICKAYGDEGGLRSLAEFARRRDLAVYNTEAGRALHRALESMPGYRCSEYLGPGHRSGEVVDGVVHQDLQHLSFADADLDLVVSGDVFEHVPDPYRGHREVFRVLRPGGRHVFTVPFHEWSLRDDVRARPGASGEPEHLAEPIYHQDPIDPRGALVYTIFGIEMLVELQRIGFTPRMYLLHKPWYGILGSNGIVFEAVKPS